MRPLRYSIYYRHVEQLPTNISNIAKHSGCNNLGPTSILRAEKCKLALLLAAAKQNAKNKIVSKHAGPGHMQKAAR